MLPLFQFCRKIPWLFFITLVIGLTAARDNLVYFAIMILLLSLLLVNMLWRYAATPMQLPRTRVLLWLALYWLWLILVLLLRPILSLSIYQFVIQSSLPLIFLVAFLHDDWQKNWSKIFLVLTFIISALAIYVLIQFFVFDYRPQGFFQDKNLIAALLNLVLWPAVARFLFVTKISARIFWGLVIFLLVFTIAVIGTHSAFLAGLLAYVIFCFCLWERLSRHLLVTISILVIMSYTIGNFQLAGHDLANVNVIYNAENSRWLVWLQTWQMIKLSPIFGNGLGTFAAIYSIFRLPGDSSAGLFAHNDYLQLWDEAGIIGLLLFVALIVSFGQLWQRLMQRMQNIDLAIVLEITGLGCALLTLAIQSFFTFNFSILPILLIAGMLLARAIYLFNTVFQFKIITINFSHYMRPDFYRLAVGFIGFLAVIMTAAIGISYLLTLQAEKYMHQKDPSDTMHELVLAQTFWPIEQRPYLALLKLDVQLLKELPVSLPQWRNLVYQQGIQEFEALRYVNPYNANSFYYRGLLAEFNPNDNASANTAQAIYAFQYGLYLDNRAYQIRMAYANLLLQQGKIETADDVLLGGIAFPYPLEPGVIGYYQLTRQVKEKLGDKRAVQTLDQLIAQNKKLLTAS
jgi:O-antigen ligase